MISSAEIKEALIRMIKLIEDRALLQSLLEWIESVQEKAQTLSKEQQESICRGKKDAAHGRIKDHHKVMSEAEQWLKKGS